jgi:hypothetical protein
MFISIDFQRDGQIRVFAKVGDETVSVTAPANRLQILLPSVVFDEVLGRMRQFVELNAQAPRLKAV